MHLWMSNIRRKQYFPRGNLSLFLRFFHPAAVYRSRVSDLFFISSFSVPPVMAKSTMTVDYCPCWIAPGDRVQVHRKTRNSEVSRDFPQGSQIILCRRSFWNSTVFLRMSKQSRTSNVDVRILTNSGWK